jgi:hypothetical protein
MACGGTGAPQAREARRVRGGIPMEDMIRKGRQLVMAIILVPGAVQLVAIACRWLASDSVPTPATLIGFTAKGLLFFFLYRGHAWARWLVGVWFALSGLASLPIGLMLLRFGAAFEAPYLFATGLAVALCGAFSLIGSAMLFGSRSVHGSLAHQAQCRKRNQAAALPELLPPNSAGSMIRTIPGGC